MPDVCKVGARRRKFTEEEDALLVEFKPRRSWVQMVEAMGISENTLRKRYAELQRAGRA